jgi:hypothetical protein
MVTQYRHLTDSELLFKVGEACLYSPIIAELARRLDLKNPYDYTQPPITQASCPSCESVLELGFDELNECFTIRNSL